MSSPPRPPSPARAPAFTAPSKAVTTSQFGIENAREETVSLYVRPRLNPAFQTWFLDPPADPETRARTNDVYQDRTQTNLQQVSLKDANAAVFELLYAALSSLPDTVRVETAETLLLDVYDRVLALYDARLSYIQEAGQCRLDVWSRLKNSQEKEEQEACVSTLEWMEQDYMLRKVDFVRDVYSALERDDQDRATKLLVELSAAYPQLTKKTEGGITTLKL